MSRQAYPQYKPSGIEWLGQIPEHWEVKALKRTFKTLNGSTPRSSNPEFWDGDIPWATPDDLGSLNEPTLKATRRMITKEGYESCGVSLAPEGSLVLSTRAPIGHLAIAGVKLCTNQGCRSLVFRGDDERRFFFYQVLTARSELQSLDQGSTFTELNRDRLTSACSASPPLDEQRAIAAFLDRETVRIDTLIEKKRRQIEWLQEKRSALISHAVTKGLAPHVPMKDSGIEWLGEIPEGWGMKCVKYMTQILRGKFTHRPRNDPRMYDGPYPFMQTGDASSALKYVREYHQTLSENGLAVSKMFPKGTLVMTIAANIGDMAILDFEACFPDSIVGFVPRRGVVLDFLYFLFIGLRPALLSTATLNTQFNLNIDRIGCVLAALPPPDEQCAIAAFLDRETARIDALVEKVEKSIELLREYRTAQISAAVTGNIDVRKEVA